MRKIFLSAVLIFLFFFLTSCSDEYNPRPANLETADITWENIKITVNEVSFIPEELVSESGTHLIEFQVKGNPPDHFVGAQIAGLMELYDDSGKWCHYIKMIKGSMDDVLLIENINVVVYYRCPSEKSKIIKFIFKDSRNELLARVGNKFDVVVKEKPSQGNLKILTETIEKSITSKKASEENMAKIKAENEEIKKFELEFRQKIESKIKSCIDSEEYLKDCLNSDSKKKEIEQIQKSYEACTSNPQEMWQNRDCDWLRDIFALKAGGETLQVSLKPNHNGKELLKNKLAKINQEQKKYCENYESKEYCSKKAKEFVCSETQTATGTWLKVLNYKCGYEAEVKNVIIGQ